MIGLSLGLRVTELPLRVLVSGHAGTVTPGGGVIPAGALRDRDGNYILDRNGNYIISGER